MAFLFGLEFKRHVLMIYKEILHNVVDHASATEVNVEVLVFDHLFRMCIRDNGKGFDKGARSQGRGLRSIASRSKALNGALTIDTQPGSGTEITIEARIARSGD